MAISPCGKVAFNQPTYVVEHSAHPNWSRVPLTELGLFIDEFNGTLTRNPTEKCVGGGRTKVAS